MKRGQEEIVGFVMIMLVMVIVLLIFLGLSFRNKDTGTRDSKEIYQFLESMGEYTTGCQIRNSEYADLGELFERCWSNDNCLNDEDSCVVLNKTLKDIFENSWNVGPEAIIKGYEFTSLYKSGDNEEKIVSLSFGICEKSIIGADYFLPAFPGRITNTLKLCY
ncbi:hypothetical protein AUJ84_00245 [Candidatus Pacearchaeota archaeon CG1_02_32_132]|nr:MAG: hypothetical protein AUJ84_00245 [Candidatus Pacearchaeota archaeon CG1_02_32_132]